MVIALLEKGALLDDPVIVQLAEKYSKTPAQIAIRWSMQVLLFLIKTSLKIECK